MAEIVTLKLRRGDKEKLRAALKKLLAKVDRNTPILLSQAGKFGASFCKIECPVDTGRLKTSIGDPLNEGIFTVTRNSVIFGTAVKYAIPVELGHKTRLKEPTPGKKAFVKGRHYMLKGVQKAIPGIIDILKGVLKV